MYLSQSRLRFFSPLGRGIQTPTVVAVQMFELGLFLGLVFPRVTFSVLFPLSREIPYCMLLLVLLLE